MELKLSDLLHILRKKLWLFLSVVFIFGAVALSISKFLITPRYETKTAVLVLPRVMVDPQNAPGYISHGVKLAPLLVKSENFLTTKVLPKVKEIAEQQDAKINTEISITELRDSITTDKNEYEFTIKVTTVDPALSYVISTALEQLIENEELMGNQSYTLTITLPAEKVSSPTSPNILLNTLLGLILGAVVGFLLIVVLDKLDITIKREEEIVERFDVPVLGVIYEHKETVRGEEAR